MNKKQREIIEAARKRGMKETKWERVNREDDINENRKKMGLPILKKEK